LRFDQLLEKRVTGPLLMKDTVLRLRAEQRPRLIDVFREGLIPTPHWDFDVFAPAGALRSTILDMAKFARVNLHLPKSLMGAAIRLSQAKSWGWDSAELKFSFPYKNGATYGSRSAFLVHPSSGTATVVLSNVAYEVDSFAGEITKASIQQ
jgi:CubicO group peptidase (beta-lactamase class C family)